MKKLTDQLIRNYCIKTARKLVTVPKLSGKHKIGKKFPTKLVFPNLLHSSKLGSRISEQELRACFCLTLERSIDNELFYALEPPTNTRMKKGTPMKTVGISGNLDLCIYVKNKSKITRNVVVEFKHGNPTPYAVKNDILKLTNEDSSGLYFLHLDKVYNNTLTSSNKKDPTLIDKIINALTNKNVLKSQKRKQLTERFLVIAFVLPHYNRLLLKTIDVIDLRTKDKKLLKANLKKQLNIHYQCDSKSKFDIIKKNGWQEVKL